ncbi:MAG: Mur ligase family protein [Patescibacteria group bacterium]
MNIKNYFRGKKITVMGLDSKGRGLQDAKYLAEKDAEVVGTDLKKAEELSDAVSLAKQYKNLHLVLGEHRLGDFRNRDFIIRAALAPLDSPYLAEARKNNIPIVSDETLFLMYAPKVLTIGVTGTRGKTTVTHMIYEIVKEANTATQGGPVYLGGNVQGKSLLHLLDEVKEGDVIVMELDSWKLQSFAENKMSPNIAVFTTFYRDHQNYYKNNMGRYWLDKTAIFINQKEGDTLIVSPQIDGILNNKGSGVKYIVSEALPLSWKLKILGEHNRDNASLALSVARVLNIPDEVSKKVLEGFGGVPGRLEYLGEKDGIGFWNDTTATTPDATLVALEALREKKGKIIWLGGGADKALEYAEFTKIAPEFFKYAILFKGVATEKIMAIMPKELLGETYVVESMKEAFEKALAVAKRDDVILLSPGAASFGIFKNEYDRGDQFVKMFKEFK